MQDSLRLFLATVVFFGIGAGIGLAQTVSDADKTLEQEASSFPGFSWVVGDELAAMPLPGGRGPLVEDAEFLRSEGIRVLISLTENAPDRKVLAAANVEQAHIPVRDFTAPTNEQIDEFVGIVRGSAARGEAVGVHCTAGLGRSGTMAAAYLVATGVSAEDAISTVRQLRPGSIETELQEAAVRQDETHRSKKPCAENIPPS